VQLPQLRRVRWAVRATLVLGVAASVMANVLHALDNPISQAIAAWPPLALLLTVELISRVPVHRRSLAFCRLLATATIASIAAWVSYWHMAGVAARYGETGASAYLLPLSVDGLIVVASICLVELGGQISSLQADAQATSRAAREAAESAANVAATAAQVAALQAAAQASQATQPVAAPQPVAAASMTASQPGAAAPEPVAASVAASRPVAASVRGRAEPTASGLIPVPSAAKPNRRSTKAALAEAAAALTQAENEKAGFKPTMTRQPRAAATTRRAPVTKPATPTSSSGRSASGAAKPRRTPAETVAAAAKIMADSPELTDAELATALGISTSRWRTIRREADARGDGLRLAA